MTVSIQLLEEWQKAKADLNLAKKQEGALRKQIAEHFIELGEGTHNEDLPDGRILKCVNKMNYRLDAKAVDEHWDELTELEKESVIWKPSLVLRQYKDTPEDRRAALDEMITITPGMPTVSIVE